MENATTLMRQQDTACALLLAARRLLDAADTGYIDHQAKVPQARLDCLAAALLKAEAAWTPAPSTV